MAHPVLKRFGKQRCFVLLLWLLIGTITTGETLASPLQITEVMSDSIRDTLKGDWWELTNAGSTSIDLTDYRWDDDGVGDPNDQAIFPSVTIEPGESLVLIQEFRLDVATWRAMWSLPAGVQVLAEDDMAGANPFSGLSKNGDSIFLYSPSDVILNTVSFPAATEGFSFQWGRNSASLGLSTNGVDGAWESAADAAGFDTGSPGVSVVPEPSSLVLALVGLTALIGRQRRRGRR